MPGNESPKAYAGMRFSTATLLLITAFAAIVCATCIGWWRIIDLGPQEPHPFLLGILSFTFHSPLWLPIVFVAYAIGRRTFSVRLVLVFAVVQSFASCLAYVAIGLLRHGF